MMNLKKYLTVREVAENLDITEGWVRDLIKTKAIRATKIGKWRIHPTDLKEFVKTRSNESISKDFP